MHVLSGTIFTGAALEDRVESVAYLTAFIGFDDARIYQRVAVSDARRDVGFKQPAVEAVRVIKLGEARIGLSFESPAPKFFRFRHEYAILHSVLDRTYMMRTGFTCRS